MSGRPPLGRAVLFELALIAGVYGAYSVVRNWFGSARVAPNVALDNAITVIRAERSLGIYNEPAVQGLFIDSTAFIQFWNLYYGLFHFLVTTCVLIWAFVGLGERFAWWRSVLLSTTVAALVGYAWFPLMPPRLLAACGTYGGCVDPRGGDSLSSADIDYVDTVTEIGGIWSFESDVIESVTNQYAAMPSLHVGWALWVVLVAWAARGADGPRWAARGLALAHLSATIFGIVVTANHYWLDVVGAIGVVGAGVGIVWVWSKVWTLRVRRAK